MTRFARSTALITGVTAAGIGLGFYANLLIAARFGVGPAMDAYLAATTLPSFLSLILTTALAATFLPVFAEERQTDPAGAWRLAASFMNLVALAGLAACAIGMAFAGPLIRLLTPGLDAHHVPIAASMLRWLLPTVALSAVNQILSGVYYAQGRFVAPMFLRISGPLLTVLWITIFGQTLEVRSLALATLSAHALQSVILVAGARRFGEGPRQPAFRFAIDRSHPALRKILRLALPMMLAMCFYKLGPAFERWLASGFGTGAISTLGYATRLIAVLQPVLISGIALSGFSLMAEHAANRNMGAFRELLSRSCGALFFASVPLAALLCAFAGPVVALVFQRGAFTAQNTSETSALFALYALGLPAGAVGTVVGQAYYALQETRIPILAGILDLALFAGLATVLAPHWGLLALPASFVFSLYLTTLLITGLLGRKTGFSLWPLLRRPFFQSLTSSGAALAIGLGLQAALPESRNVSLACLATSGVIYLAIQILVFKSPEASGLLRLLPGGKR